MAESILFDVAGSIIIKLGSLAVDEVGLICGAKDEYEKLKDTVTAIQAVIRDAEKRESESDSLKDWLSKLKDALYDADDLMDEFSYESLRLQVMTKNETKFIQVRTFFSKSNQVVFRLKMGHKIKNLREKLDAIDADRTRFNLSTSSIGVIRDDGLRNKRLIDSDSFIRDNEVIGMDDDRKLIINHLITTDNIEENVSVISIIGIGGLGKTTLAKSILNDKSITTNFELKLWVSISEVFDLEDVVKRIIDSATMQTPDPRILDSATMQTPDPQILDSATMQTPDPQILASATMQTPTHLLSKLRAKIDGKKYLLILDNVWNEDPQKWEDLKRLLMGGAKGSKVLITTRSEQVATTCHATLLHSLQGLSEDNSWLLFKRLAFDEGEEVGNTNLIGIGKEIVAKLKGVPLAIRVIGSLLYCKKSKDNVEDDWLSFKDNELGTVIQQENEMLSILKLSYNHLPSHLKQCFKYCSLFPKDHEIIKDEVIRQWAAQGYIQSHGRNKPIEDIGNDYFMELLRRSFFQDMTMNDWRGIEFCKMHDFIHDLACSVGENVRVTVIADVNVGGINERTRHISFDSKLPELCEPFLVAKKLRTFLLKYYPSLPHTHSSIDYLHRIFTTFSKLRTLKLYIVLIELPKSISKLKHLRYLDLSLNQSIKYLPDSITKLYNLETLILHFCRRLIELPRDIKNLINLRHLDLYDCWGLTHMPKGLGELTSLQTLNLFVLGKDGGIMLNELNELNNLRGKLVIKGLEFCRIVDLHQNGNCLRLKTDLQELQLDWCCAFKELDWGSAFEEGGEGVLEYLQPHSNIQKISIKSYPGVRLCNWLSSDSLVRLVSLSLSSCRRLQHLPQLHQIPSLKDLCLWDLDCVEYIVENDSSSSLTLFPSLENLQICRMPKLKGLYKGEISAQTSVLIPTFPRLSKLDIVDCHQLSSIPWHPPLQSLELFDVSVKLLDMVMKMTTNFAQDPSSALRQLKLLLLQRINDFEFLPQEFFRHFTALEILKITECDNLQLSFSRDDDVDDDETWKKLVSLRQLNLKGLPKIQHLPEGLQSLTTLGHFRIDYCENLRSIPEWLYNLTSLSRLEIINFPKLTSLPEGIHNLTSLSCLVIWLCPNITSLPEGMVHLRSLQRLKIGYCPKLEDRCKKETGEDWPKIAHVPYLDIYQP